MLTGKPMDIEYKIPRVVSRGAKREATTNSNTLVDDERSKRAKTDDSMVQRSVVKAAGVYDQIGGWANSRTAYVPQNPISTPVGMAGSNVPGVTIPGMPGMGPQTPSRETLPEQQKHGAVNWTFTAMPFKTMMARDPYWKQALQDIATEQVEQFLLARQEPVFCDNKLDRADLSVPHGVALCSLRALNRYLLIAGKAASGPNGSKMLTSGEILNRFKLLGMLVNLDNHALQMPSERAVQTATITIGNTPLSNMPNFWQSFTHCGTAGMRMGFKVELINTASDVPWTIEDCRSGVHSPFLTAGPFPDQTIHKIRPGGKKDDDVIAWCVIPQVVRNPKGWTDELTVVRHVPISKMPKESLESVPTHPVNGSGAMIYFGIRNHESQGGRALGPAELMQMLTPTTGDEVLLMQERGNRLFDRINLIIKKGMYMMGASPTYASWELMYTRRERSKEFGKMLQRMQGVIANLKVSVEAPPPSASASASEGPHGALPIGFGGSSAAAPQARSAAADVKHGGSEAASPPVGQASGGSSSLNSAASNPSGAGVLVQAAPGPQASAPPAAEVLQGAPGSGAPVSNPSAGKGAGNRLAPRVAKTAGKGKGKKKGKGKGKSTGKAGHKANSDDDDDYDDNAAASADESGSESGAESVSNRTDADGDSEMGTTDYE